MSAQRPTKWLRSRVARLAGSPARIRPPEPGTVEPLPPRDAARWLEGELAEEELRDLVLIGGTAPIATGNRYAERYPQARVHVLAARALSEATREQAGPQVLVTVRKSREAVHRHLDTLPDPQVVIDRGSPDVDDVHDLLFHVADGGLYVIENPPDRAFAAGPDPADDILTRSAAQVRGHATASVARRGDLLIVRKAGVQAHKLRNAHADAVLSARLDRPWGRTIRTVPEQTFEARTKVWLNMPEKDDTFHRVMTIPELYLREYHDVVCAPRQLVMLDNYVLPISFHKPLLRRLWNRSGWTVDAGRWFVEPTAELRAAEHLPGVYYHLDSEFPGHFGHFITQDIGKLWGWHEAKTLYPELKVLFSTDVAGAGPKAHQLTMLGAFGIGPDEIVCIDRPVRVDTLIGATSMFYNGRYVHPEIAEIWDALRAGLRSPTLAPDAPTKLYVSRRNIGLRKCTNEDELAALFVRHGFTVVQPETMTVPEQVDLFAGAEVVAGCGGSGMFSMIYCQTPGRRIVISSTRYGVKNEYTIAALRGGDYHHFYCAAESDWFHSPFRFDFDRDGPALEALL